MNAADNLVAMYPDTVSQLTVPVYKYFAKLYPFNGTEQDLYLSVFRPASRRVSPASLFPAIVQTQNPGIRTPQDYVNLVNRVSRVKHTPAETAALQNLAGRLKVSVESLDKLITFESRWNPQAINKTTGARGLIQFMPDTAAGLGYSPSVADATVVKPFVPVKLDTKGLKLDIIGTFLIVGGIGYYFLTKSKGV